MDLPHFLVDRSYRIALGNLLSKSVLAYSPLYHAQEVARFTDRENIAFQVRRRVSVYVDSYGPYYLFLFLLLITDYNLLRNFRLLSLLKNVLFLLSLRSRVLLPDSVRNVKEDQLPCVLVFHELQIESMHIHKLNQLDLLDYLKGYGLSFPHKAVLIVDVSLQASLRLLLRDEVRVEHVFVLRTLNRRGFYPCL